ncbi:MAG: response regulator, partial [Limisphaerales bacterium]
AASGASATAGSPSAAVIPQAGTILVVDDEKPVRLLLERTLARAHFQVLLAEDGRRAVDLYREHADQIDCVVLDLTMPEMDGLQTYQQLRQIRDRVTVVLASGYDEQEVQGRFAGHDVAGFIQKPFDREALLAVIHGAMQSRRAASPGSF